MEEEEELRDGIEIEFDEMKAAGWVGGAAVDGAGVDFLGWGQAASRS